MLQVNLQRKALRVVLAMLFSFSCCFSVTVFAAATMETIQVPSLSLEGNLEGNDSERQVFVSLPDGYANNPNKRYPVVYFLHGYGATAQIYVDFLGLPALVDEAVAEGSKEMIIVIPDAYTRWGGSFYSSSPTIGDWEGFIAQDLVSYIDTNYRTIANRENRGLSGHSMGGYGTLRIGMKHPNIFSSLFVMSAGALLDNISSQEEIKEEIAAMAEAEAKGETPANSRQALYAAWAPNPNNPPYYFDWPYQDGQLNPLFQARWMANAPLAMLDQYVPALKSYKAIFIDVGNEDGLSTSNIKLDEALTRLNVEHDFEIYEGNHGNRVVQRFRENVLPFFSENLSSD